MLTSGGRIREILGESAWIHSSRSVWNALPVCTFFYMPLQEAAPSAARLTKTKKGRGRARSERDKAASPVEQEFEIEQVVFAIMHTAKTALLVILMALLGQSMQRSMKSLSRKLALLNLKLLNTISDILRAILQQPCALECFAGVRIGMPLLLAVLSSSATYIILVLQFSHCI
ncbi:hypothetical protein EVAR_82011_1 [Eumeta japonica]|uniref:Uncharacterized protein n=1 Tax=Eumeta variegata TaxID=151549 RepID=A0A4C1VUX3_EUMVA|nr:hypothetical protein EVAR_82011_1 [Eumeta japonica]